MLHFRRDPHLTTELARDLAAGFRGEVDAELSMRNLPVAVDFEAVELAWLTAYAIDALRSDWDAGPGRVASVFLARAYRPTRDLHPGWDRDSARAFAEATTGLPSIPGHLVDAILEMLIQVALSPLDVPGPIIAKAATHLLDIERACVRGEFERPPSVESQLALASLAGPVVDRRETVRVAGEWADLPFSTIELDAIARLPFELRVHLEPLALEYGDDEMSARLRRDAGGRALAADAGYARAVREILEAFDDLLDELHAGRIDYVSDRLVGRQDAVCVARAFQVASFEDAPWFSELVGRMLPRIVVAPNASKTVPSQSLAHLLARATAEYPIPESVAALAESLQVVRHAGLQKKLDRTLRRARKSLPATARLVPPKGGG